tara:strand:- start:2956 stop:3909 length:954 start_codon:yes stop_codon:yes gene_type:complete
MERNYTTITFFKNYTPTFFSFIHFYREVWGCKKFIFNVGYTDEETYRYIFKNYMENTVTNPIKLSINTPLIQNVEIYNLQKNNVDYIFILYKTPVYYKEVTDFNKVKNAVFYIIFNVIKINANDFYISVDDDEFLYSSNMKKLKEKIESEGMYSFHFVESYPSNTVDELKLCLQPWYFNACRRNIMNHSYHPCKTYLFNLRKNNNNFNTYLGFWRHDKCGNVSEKACELVTLNNGDISIEELKSYGICYHITGLTLKNLWYVKGKNRYTNNGIDGNYKNLLSDYKYISDMYKIIDDEFIFSIIQNKDIELMKECETK